MTDTGPDSTARTWARVGVVRLRLSDFRSYAALRLDVSPASVVLTGPNGAGKTNILEALSFLAPGRGLRGARLSEAARNGAPGGTWAVAATALSTGAAMGACGEVRIDIGTGRAAGERDRRVVRINGRPAPTQAALGEVLGLLWLTPAMDRLFQEGASGRRRFLDRLVNGLDPEHAGRCSAYEHALRERAGLLRGGRGIGRDAKVGRRDARVWLDGLEDAMARHGVAVAAARREAVARLDRACAEGLGPFPGARLALGGGIESWLDEAPALAVEDRFREALALGRGRDAETGGAGEGVHRTDLLVRHAARGMPAGQCSTGEQKALLIALILAQARLQAEVRASAPVLLLDEVAAHLDATRRKALYDVLDALGLQAWMTGTDRSLFAGLEGRAQFFRVEQGRIAAETGG